MRLGLIARADVSRGLGSQSHGYYRHLKPAKTLVVDFRDLSPFPHQFDLYPDGEVRHANSLGPGFWRGWLRGLDVVLSDVAREQGVRSILHVNPEFHRYTTDPALPKPDVMIAPTTWRLNLMPEVTHFPYPVDRDVFPFRLRAQAKTFVHVVGHKAAADRNGTMLVLEALRWIASDVRIIIRSQARIGRTSRHAPKNVDLDIQIGDRQDPAELYSDADMLILPRRYGGQSLPMNEAASMGLGVITLDVAPQNEWCHPQGLVAAKPWKRLRMQPGVIPTFTCNPRQLAATIDRFAQDATLAQAASIASDRYAESISWTRMLGAWLQLLGGVQADAAYRVGV
jgi:glycosyltransferase involved in cell wall biosynthesis